MARLSLPTDEAMTPEQRAVCEEVISGSRGKIPSPMIAWLQNPELARRSQLLGEVLRFGTTLGPELVELAILVCARNWTAHQVWSSHKIHGLAAGIEPHVIEAIASRQAPKLPGKQAEVVYEACVSLLATHRLPDAEYGRAVEVLGEPGVVELVALLGYYSMVCLTANAFELGMPENRMAEFDQFP